MLTVLIQKLESLELLSEEAKSRLRRLPTRMTNFAPRENILLEGEPRGDVRVMIEGVATRVKTLEGGRQAILGFLLPGDVDETDSFVHTLDHGIVAVTAGRIVHVSRNAFDQLLPELPDLQRGFRRLARLEESVRRVWLANMGQRAAGKRLSHLLCELRTRFAAVGMGGPDWFTNPLTQEHLANVQGVSPVHMNRMMQHLRELGLIRVEGHVLRLPSPPSLEQYAEFDGAYLRGEPRVGMAGAHPLPPGPEREPLFTIP